MVALAISCLCQGSLRAQLFGHPRMKPAGELLHKQDPPKTSPRVLAEINADKSNSHVVVSISRQRAYLMVGDEIALDTPISSGKAGHETPQGNFRIQNKDPNHRSSIYGAFCVKDKKGLNRIVRAGVSLHIDSAPSGTYFVGAPMQWFCEFHDAVGMHVGILPGYPASHGCVRLPAESAKLIYDNVILGARVEVQP